MKQRATFAVTSEQSIHFQEVQQSGQQQTQAYKDKISCLQQWINMSQIAEHDQRERRRGEPHGQG